MGSSEVSETLFAVVEKGLFLLFCLYLQMLKHVPNVINRVIDTRWSARYEAVRALQQCFIGVVVALNELCDQKENIDTRGQALGILNAIQHFSFVSFLQFWLEILKESYDTQNYLQRKVGLLKTVPQDECIYCFFDQ